MKEFGDWLKKVSSESKEWGIKHAFINAIVAHTWLVYIHPFIDGNGRVARLLMNLILMRSGYPIAIITKEDRLRYYDALEISQTSDLSAFISLLSECIYESLEEYEIAVKEQRERKEWAESLAERFTEKEEVRARNEYEVWKSAMELLKSYFRQTSEFIDSSTSIGNIKFSDFGNLEFEKYLSLRIGQSAKKTWFFRLDFKSGDKVVRYLFFFGTPSYQINLPNDVTLHISREEPSNSFYYERLDNIHNGKIPQFVEISYSPEREKFIARTNTNAKREEKIDTIGKTFFENIIDIHFHK